MIGSRWSLVIALVIPTAAVFVGVPVTSHFSVTVWGIPLVFAWLFAWLPLTSLLLWLTWRRFDASVYQQIEGNAR